MNKIFLLPVFLVVFLFSCNHGNTGGSGIGVSNLDEYSFVMSDSLSSPVAEGTLTVTDLKDSLISGTYNISKVYQDQYPGINTMKGYFSGVYNPVSNKLFLNMNPKVSDNNVFVKLTIYKSYLGGEWYYSTMVGKVSQGYFKANKLN